MTDAITLRGVSHRFGDHLAVDDVDLDRRARASASACSGPNGAGKTTTIRLITTLLPVQPGDGRRSSAWTCATPADGRTPAHRLRAAAAVDRRRADRPGERRAVRAAVRRAAAPSARSASTRC